MSRDQITDELIARQAPEAQAIILLLVAKIAELESRLSKTPQNSSLSPSTQHPQAKPVPASRVRVSVTSHNHESTSRRL